MSRKRPDLSERNFKHGLKTREYKNRFYILWSTMKNRCYNLKSKDYPSYGGRGINVADPKNPFKTLLGIKGKGSEK